MVESTWTSVCGGRFARGEYLRLTGRGAIDTAFPAGLRGAAADCAGTGRPTDYYIECFTGQKVSGGRAYARISAALAPVR